MQYTVAIDTEFYQRVIKVRQPDKECGAWQAITRLAGKQAWITPIHADFLPQKVSEFNVQSGGVSERMRVAVAEGWSTEARRIALEILNEDAF